MKILINGFYDQLFLLIQHMVDTGLLKESNQLLLLQSDSIDDLLYKMENYQPPQLDQWIKEEEL